MDSSDHNPPLIVFEADYFVKARSREPRTRSWNFAQEQWDIRNLTSLKRFFILDRSIQEIKLKSGYSNSET